jgi:hypothetical protein
MDSARSWLQKLQPRDKLRASTKRKEGNSDGKGDPDVQGSAEALSNVTKQKVAAAKQYIENHYKEQMKNLQERKERYGSLPLRMHSGELLLLDTEILGCQFGFDILYRIQRIACVSDRFCSVISCFSSSH